ncbi:MAG: cytochrome c [Xanthomonadales bacterium]|nr:cytochrome c [Xanthomonadales bacterium]
MKKTTLSFLALPITFLLLVPSVSMAEGNPAKGQEKAVTCEACHGKDGRSIDPNYPNLGGQYYSYLVKALSDYRSGNRSNAIMASFAANLSNQDIEDLAAWYASQQGLKDLSVK